VLHIRGVNELFVLNIPGLLLTSLLLARGVRVATARFDPLPVEWSSGRHEAKWLLSRLFWLVIMLLLLKTVL